MSYFSHARKIAVAVITATGLSLAGNTLVFADPPEVVIKGAGKALKLNNPVRFEGTARDPQGINEIFGTIQNAETERFITQDGGSSRNAGKARMEFKFTKSIATRWVSQSFELPKGNYIFRIRVKDSEDHLSPIMEVPFTATGAGGPALAAAPAAKSAAPRTAIQFPKNGAELTEASAFNGIAKDDQSVNSVIATIMDTKSGQFLTPNGKFSRAGQFNLRTIRGKNAQWTIPKVDLPPGDYLLSVKAIDNNGQEGQWSQSKFTIAQAATPVVAVAGGAAAKAANGMAYCSNNGSDADGDGFGWQNQASCVVKGSKADTHPTCASSASDPDGDGFGWENEKSCIVVTHCKSTNSDPDGDGFGWENQRSCIVLDTKSSTRFPSCANGAASDPDGDGFGWENNATCKVN